VIAADSTKEAAASLAQRYVLNPTSVNEENVAPLTVYPQPVTDALTISNPEMIRTVQIVDMTGQVLRVFAADPLSMPLDVSGLSSGSYVVRMLRVDASVQHSLITVVR
jgi:hypothetical protein